MFEKIKSDTKSSMDKSIDNFKAILSKIRAGRPNPSILDQVIIDYFGSNTPIKQLANIFKLERFNTLNEPFKVWGYGVSTPPPPGHGSTGAISTAQVLLQVAR